MVHAMEHKIWAVSVYTIYYILVYQVAKYLPSNYAELANFLSLFQVGKLYFWPALFMVIVGAHFPDFDLDFGTRYHRSPLTHSFIIPLALAIFYLLQRPSPDVMRLLAFFFLGYSSHLFLDIFPAKASILARAIAPFKNYTPGDIRGIPEKMEKPWLIGSGLLTLALAILYLFFATHPSWLQLIPL